MKKISIFIALAIVLLALAPIIGNTFVEKSLQTNLAKLESYGLGIQKKTEESSYLNSSKHYEFLLKDSDKFVEYMSQYSNQQVPAYVNAALEGVLIGMDVKYSNIPFTKAVSIDIYPLALSKSMTDSLQKNDLDFYTYLDKFLKSKGILYHINYNMMSENFDGFIQDVSEKYTLKDGTIMNLKLAKAIFEGSGELVAPNRLSSSIGSIDLDVENKDAKVVFKLADLSSSYSYDSQTTYVSGGQLKSIDIFIEGASDTITINAKDMKANVSSNNQGPKAELNAKASAKTLHIESKKLLVDMDNFAYDVAVDDLDKNTLEDLSSLVTKANAGNTPALQKEISDTVIALFAKGAHFKIAQLSLDKITLNKTQDLGGFDMKMDLKIKEDPALASKIQTSPLLVAQNIDMLLNLKISKMIYANLTANQPMAGAMNAYIKEDGDNLIFDISFKNGELKMNGKALK